ncbi:TPA: hypothetical protein QC443_001453 [Bacillus cereus]|uniref:hypothetical protein n=1 Tax=Bacillus cereus TaxID=1396 RepID=UPI001926774B|nr:hypothetical protein [Bacillus cereus]MBL3881112.1 hypothetical protein [Bacillus cereus]HDR7980236.1 hypothetical protein [Bacillus cereus]HDR8076467.1 hypothetical protein [Bacillus cereus]HDR8206658.1 hypothetical protein [Bacillus cereus]HDR8212688.1 hypothetical protein [Bacillus cereus]
MSLLQALLETINQEWSSQCTDVFGEVNNVLSIAYIAPVLAKYIESEGDKVPTEFDPNKFNSDEDGNYCTVEIRVCPDQDTLIEFCYE